MYNIAQSVQKLVLQTILDKGQVHWKLILKINAKIFEFFFKENHMTKETKKSNYILNIVKAYFFKCMLF